jgi:hypothetical protein
MTIESNFQAFGYETYNFKEWAELVQEGGRASRLLTIGSFESRITFGVYD